MFNGRQFLAVAFITVVISLLSCTQEEQLPPLHLAVQSGLLVEVKQLVIGGHDVNQRDERYGFTPLHQAAFFGHKDIVEFLIAEGADVTAKNNAGSTSLYLANGKGHKEIVELLKQHGATEEY